VRISLEIQGGNHFKSAQAANLTGGVSLEEGKDRYCAPKEKNRYQKGGKRCHLRSAGYILVI
jgi:hypothetical protein